MTAAAIAIAAIATAAWFMARWERADTAYVARWDGEYRGEDL